jgi:hypothetical protein
MTLNFSLIHINKKEPFKMKKVKEKQNGRGKLELCLIIALIEK